jgi:hypothetical protein
MFENVCEEMDQLRKKDISGFSFSEKIYFSMGVVYRYRNNIFHGNKKVDSWLQYRDCISKCIGMMQLLIPIPKNRPLIPIIFFLILHCNDPQRSLAKQFITDSTF